MIPERAKEKELNCASDINQIIILIWIYTGH